MQTIVAIVGGTGAEGSGLAARFAKAGAPVRIGSRNLEKAQEAARRIGDPATGHTNADAVTGAGIVILTVPLSAQVETLKSIRGSFAPGAILVDATVPLEVAIGGRVSRTADVVGWLGRAASSPPCSGRTSGGGISRVKRGGAGAAGSSGGVRYADLRR